MYSDPDNSYLPVPSDSFISIKTGENFLGLLTQINSGGLLFTYMHDLHMHDYLAPGTCLEIYIINRRRNCNIGPLACRVLERTRSANTGSFSSLEMYQCRLEFDALAAESEQKLTAFFGCCRSESETRMGPNVRNTS